MTAARRMIVSLVLSLAGWAMLAPFIASRLVIERPLAKADVIVVLAGAQAYAERTDVAAALYGHGVASRVILTDDGVPSGWSPEANRNPLFVERARSRLLARGVPPEAIETLASEVGGTVDEARLVAATAKERRWRVVLLATSPEHTRRAMAIFERTFELQSVSATVGVVSTGDRPDTLWWLRPGDLRRVGGEYAKLLFYALAY